MTRHRGRVRPPAADCAARDLLFKDAAPDIELDTTRFITRRENACTSTRSLVEHCDEVTHRRGRGSYVAPRDRAERGSVARAELDGHLVAAISTTTGEAIADPFRRTAEIVDVLRLRLSQLNARPTFHARLLSLLRPAWNASSER